MGAPPLRLKPDSADLFIRLQWQDIMGSLQPSTRNMPSFCRDINKYMTARFGLRSEEDITSGFCYHWTYIVAQALEGTDICTDDKTTHAWVRQGGTHYDPLVPQGQKDPIIDPHHLCEEDEFLRTWLLYGKNNRVMVKLLEQTQHKVPRPVQEVEL